MVCPSGCSGYDFRGNIAAAAGVIFHNRLLAEDLPEALGDDASQRICAAARRAAYDIAYGFNGIIL